MGSRHCLLTETFLFMLALMMHTVYTVSSPRVCPVSESSSLLLKDKEVLLVPDTEVGLSQDVVLQRCRIKEHFELNFWLAKTMGFIPNYVTDVYGQKWFKVKYYLNYQDFYVRLWVSVDGISQEGLSVEGLSLIDFMGAKVVSKGCINPVYNVTINTPVKLAKLCDGQSDDLDSIQSIWPSDLYGSDAGNEENNDDTNYRSSFRGGHVIFIPVGAIIFLLSVCLRCCLCPRRKMVQRVRTITVIGRVPITTSSNFVHVSEPTPSDPTDLPPSYADIEDELPPPTYSELESINGMLSESADGGGEPQQNTDTGPSSDSTVTQNSTDAAHVPDGGMTVEGDLSETETRSVLSQVLTAGSRTLKSQFSFKPMKEEEE